MASYHKALAIKPDYAKAHNNLGIAFKELGRLDEAVTSYRNALVIDPDFVEAHYNHGAIFKNATGDPEIDKLKQLLKLYDLPENDRNMLLFALGEAHDDLGLYAEAFSYFRRANEAKAKQATFDAEGHRRQTMEIRRVNRERSGSRVDNPELGERVPIFVVGISRSGKTLVESLLSQHKSVHGAGERKEWARAVKKILETYSISKSLPCLAQSLSNEQLREIRK